MTTRWALAPASVSDQALREAGLDLEAKKFVPKLGQLSSSDVAAWVEVEPVEGDINITAALLDGDVHEWREQTLAGKPVWVNATRLVVIEY